MGLLNVHKVQTKSGEGVVSHYGDVLWNKLPADLKSVETLGSVKSGIKYCFSLMFLAVNLSLCVCVCVCVCVYLCMVGFWPCVCALVVGY